MGLHGTAGADRFVMREDFLKKPISVPRVDCTIDIETSGGKIRTKLDQLAFKGTPVRIALTNAGRRLEGMELSSGPLDVGDLQEYISLSFVKRLPAVMDAISGGRVAVRELIFEKPHAFKALLSLEDVEAQYKKFRFEGISGDLRLDREKIMLTHMSANSGNSVFRDVSGSIPFFKKGMDPETSLKTLSRTCQHMGQFYLLPVQSQIPGEGHESEFFVLCFHVFQGQKSLECVGLLKDQLSNSDLSSRYCIHKQPGASSRKTDLSILEDNHVKGGLRKVPSLPDVSRRL